MNRFQAASSMLPSSYLLDQLLGYVIEYNMVVFNSWRVVNSSYTQRSISEAVYPTEAFAKAEDMVPNWGVVSFHILYEIPNLVKSRK